MTKMLYKEAGDNVGAKGEPYVIRSGSVKIDGEDFDWVIVDDSKDSDDVAKATKDGWSKEAKPAKKKKATK